MKSLRKSNADIKKLIEKKVFMIESFVYGANKVFKGVDFRNGKEVGYCAINYFHLHSLALELIIKVFYELEYKREANRTHDILEIYEKLGAENKQFIENEFNSARARKDARFEKANKDSIDIDGLNSCVSHTLKEVLIENKKTIVNLKYTGMAPKTNLPYDNEFYLKIIDFIKNSLD